MKFVKKKFFCLRVKFLEFKFTGCISYLFQIWEKPRTARYGTISLFSVATYVKIYKITIWGKLQQKWLKKKLSTLADQEFKKFIK